jgi:hypothetical protein
MLVIQINFPVVVRYDCVSECGHLLVNAGNGPLVLIIPLFIIIDYISPYQSFNDVMFVYWWKKKLNVAILPVCLLEVPFCQLQEKYEARYNL